MNFIYIDPIPRVPSEWSFGVDCVLHNSSQEDVYDSAAKDTVKRALDGFKYVGSLHRHMSCTLDINNESHK